MNPQKSVKIREKFRTIHYIFYIEYERLEFLLNYPINLLNMEFVLREESKKKQSIVVMDLDELEKRLSKGYRVYKKIRTTLNLKDEWDFIKLKILFMRQYSQLYMDAFEPDLGYFYLQKADDYVEKRKRINRTAWEDDVNFYKYLVEIDRTNFFILTNQYHELLKQCEVYIDCASKLEEYKKKPINILVPFRIYVGCGMIYEFFNQDNDLVVNAFLRGVQIIEKNIDDVGRYFLQNDLLIYVQAYVKIVKCKLRLRDYENAELWARSTLKFIEDNYYLLRLEQDSKVVKKIQNLHKKALKELLTNIVLKSNEKKQQSQQIPEAQEENEQDKEVKSPTQNQSPLQSPSPLAQPNNTNLFERIRLFKLQTGGGTTRNYNSPVNQGGDTTSKKLDYPKSRFEQAVKDEDNYVYNINSPKDVQSIQAESPLIQFEEQENYQQIDAIELKTPQEEDKINKEESLVKNDNEENESKEEQDQKSIISKEERNISQRNSQKNIEIPEREEKINEDSQGQISEKQKEKNHQNFLKNLAKRLIAQSKTNKQTNLKPISQIKSEIDENQDQVDLISINSQFFNRDKFYNLPKSFPTTINNFNADLDQAEEKENEESKTEIQGILEENAEQGQTVRRISSMMSNGQFQNDKNDDNSLSNSVSLNQNINNNDSLGSIKRNSITSLKSTNKIEGGGSLRLIGSQTNLPASEKKRNSFLEIPNVNFTETNDKNLSQSKNQIYPTQDYSVYKGNSSRLIHLIPENQNEEESPIKKNSKQGSLSHIKFENINEQKMESQNNIKQQWSQRNIAITPTSLQDIYESPKSLYNQLSSKQLEGNHFALNQENHLNNSFEDMQLDSIKYDRDDFSNQNISRITKNNNKSENIDITLNSDRKNLRRQSSNSDVQSESQNRFLYFSNVKSESETSATYFPNQKISSFNQIEQIPEAFEDDSPHKLSKSRDPTPQYFHQIKVPSQGSQINENIKIESKESDRSSKLNRSRSPYRELSLQIANSSLKSIAEIDNKLNPKNQINRIEIIAPSSPSKSSNANESQIKFEYSSPLPQENQNNLLIVQNDNGQQQQTQQVSNRRSSLLSIPSSYQSPLDTPSGSASVVISNRLKNLFKAQFSPQPGVDSPDSIKGIKIDLTKVRSEIQGFDLSNPNNEQKNSGREFTPNTNKDDNSSVTGKIPFLSKRESQKSQGSVQISGVYNKMYSNDSNDNFMKNLNSGSIYNSENQNSLASLNKFASSSQEGQTPANHFLIPQANTQPRKKSIFSDQKEQIELANKLEKISINSQQSDTEQSDSKISSQSPIKGKKYLNSYNNTKDQKQTDLQNKFQSYLTKSEYRIKQVKRWSGGNLNTFFKNEIHTNRSPIPSNTSRKVESPIIKSNLKIKNSQQLDIELQSLLDKQVRKKSQVEQQEPSFKVNLDFNTRPSIVSPQSAITPFLGQKQSEREEIKSFSQGIQQGNSNQYLPPPSPQQMALPRKQSIHNQQQKQLYQSDYFNSLTARHNPNVPQITLQAADNKTKNIQINDEENLDAPKIVIQHANELNVKLASPQTQRRFSTKDQSTFRSIVERNARKSLINLNNIQPQPSPYENQYQSVSEFQVNPSTPNQQFSLSQQVSPISSRQGVVNNMFFPSSKSTKNSIPNSPREQQPNTNLNNNANPNQIKNQNNYNIQINLNSIQNNPSQIPSPSTVINNPNNTPQQNNKSQIIKFIQNQVHPNTNSKLNDINHQFPSINPQDAYLFQYTSPKQNNQMSKYGKQGAQDSQSYSQSQKVTYPTTHHSQNSYDNLKYQQSHENMKQPQQQQPKFISQQSQQQFQQYHSYNQIQPSSSSNFNFNLLNHQTYFNNQTLNPNYQSGENISSDHLKHQTYFKQQPPLQKHRKSNSQSNINAFRFQTEGNYEDVWKQLSLNKLNLTPRPSPSSKRIKTQPKTPKSCRLNSNPYNLQENSFVNNHNKAILTEYGSGRLGEEEDDCIQDQTTLDDENPLTIRSGKLSTRKLTSQNNLGILSDPRLDSSESQGKKKIRKKITRPFTMSEAEIDKYILKKDIEEVVYLQDYFQNKHQKDVKGNKECISQMYNRISFKKNVQNNSAKQNENQENSNSINKIYIRLLNNDNMSQSDQINENENNLKLKHINSILLNDTQSNSQSDEVDALKLQSSRDTNDNNNFQSLTLIQKITKRNSLDLQDRSKLKSVINKQKQIPKIKNKRLSKNQYGGFTDLYTENQKNNLFYQSKEEEEEGTKDNIFLENMSSSNQSQENSEGDSSSESNNEACKQSNDEKNNAAMQKQFITFFGERWKEDQYLNCFIDNKKTNEWSIHAAKSDKATTKIVFRSSRNEECFMIDQLLLFPNDLLNSSVNSQSQNNDDGGSFESKVKIIKEKFIMQACENNNPQINNNINQFQYLTFRNSILQSLQIQTNVKRLPLQDKIITIWPIILCALFDYFKKQYKLQFFIPREKNISYQGQTCIDKSLKFQKTGKVQQFIENNHLIPYGIDAISASLIQMMLNQLLKFHMRKMFKLNGVTYTLNYQQVNPLSANQIKQRLTKVIFFQMYDPPVQMQILEKETFVFILIIFILNTRKTKNKKSTLKLKQSIKESISEIYKLKYEQIQNQTYWWENALGKVYNMENCLILTQRFNERFVSNRWSFLKFTKKSKFDEDKFYIGWIKIFYQPERGEIEQQNIFKQQNIRKKFFFQLLLQSYSNKRKKMSKIFPSTEFLYLFEDDEQPIISLEEYIFEIILDKQSKKQLEFLIQCKQQILKRLELKEFSFFLRLNNPTYGFTNIPTIASLSFKGKSSYKCSQVIEESDDDENQNENASKAYNQLQQTGIVVKEEDYNRSQDELTMHVDQIIDRSIYIPDKSNSFAAHIYTLINPDLQLTLIKEKQKHHFWIRKTNEYLNVFIRKVKQDNSKQHHQYPQSNLTLGQIQSISHLQDQCSNSSFFKDQDNKNYDGNYLIDDYSLKDSEILSIQKGKRGSSPFSQLKRSSIEQRLLFGIQSPFLHENEDNYDVQSIISNENMSILEFQANSPVSQRRSTQPNQSQVLKELKLIQPIKVINQFESQKVQIFIYNRGYEIQKCGYTPLVSIFDRFNMRYSINQSFQLQFAKQFHKNNLNFEFSQKITSIVKGQQKLWNGQSGKINFAQKELPFENFKYQLILNEETIIKRVRPYQEYIFLHKNLELGRLIVRVTVYQNPQASSSLSYHLSIQRYYNKNQQWKIIFNSEDLKYYFQMSEEYTSHKLCERSTDSIFVIRTQKICQTVLDQIILLKQNIYSKPTFKFNISNDGQPTHINSYLYYKNDLIEPSFKDAQSQCTYYLDSSVKSTRLVAHYIIKNYNQYIITTIQKHLTEDVWILKLYLPLSQRRSISYFSSTDLENFKSSDFRYDWFSLKNNIPQPTFYEFLKIYYANTQSPQLKKSNIDHVIQSINQCLKQTLAKSDALTQEQPLQRFKKLDEIQESYYYNQKIEEKHNQNIENQSKQRKSIFGFQKPSSFLRRLQTNNFEQINQLKYKTQSFLMNLQIVSQEMNKTLISKSTSKLNNLYKYIEIAVWEDMLKHLSIIQSQSSIYLQFKQSEKIPLNEFIDMKQSVNEKGSFVFIEYYLVPVNEKPLNFLEPFTEIHYSVTQNYDILMRYSFYDKLNFYSKKVNLKEALNLYIADGFYQYQMSYMHSTLHQSELLNICKYITFKINSQSIGSIVSIDQEFKYLNEQIFSR